MAVNAGQLHSQTNGTTNIDTVLTQEAYRIGQDVHRRILHTSPWIDLVKKSAFPDGMGYVVGTLIYDRVLPTTTANGGTLGLQWTNVGDNSAGAFTETIPPVESASTLDQILTGARDTTIGPADGLSYVQFSRQLKQYELKRAVVESPRINVEDLRFAAHRQEQLKAAVDAMADSTRYGWEERNRDEYDRLAANLIPCLASGTAVQTADQTSARIEGTATADLDIKGGSDLTPTANISNKITDMAYFRLVRAGAGSNAYGRENGRPVFALVLSSEASYQLQTEAGFRDDVRYNNAAVSDLIAPLGVEKSFRGFYHMIDDLAPRFTVDGNGVVDRVQPYGASSGVVTTNASYETADYEAAYVVHPDVMECAIPEPVSGSQGLAFDPASYSGDFKWKNLPDEVRNPDSLIGFFRGVMASASKPVKTDFGYVVLFKRTSATPAA